MTEGWTDNFVTEVCDYLQERRAELGLTKYEVAQRSGLSWQSISAYENHTRRPTLECLAKVAIALELRPSELLAKGEARIGLSDDLKIPSKQAAKRKVAKKAPRKRP